MSGFVSTAPAMYEGLLGLVTGAAAQQSPPAYVAPFEIIQYEPASYIVLSGIRGQRFDIETIGYPTFAMTETYELYGRVSVWTGASPSPQDLSVATTVMDQTYALFYAAVMTPAMSNRLTPIFNVSSPLFPDGAVNMMLPGDANYEGMPGNISGAEDGWSGVLDFSFMLRAYLTSS